MWSGTAKERAKETPIESNDSERVYNKLHRVCYRLVHFVSPSFLKGGR